MEKYFNWVTITTSAVGAYLAMWLGGCDKALQAIITLVILDYATGIARAFVERKLDSRIGIRGIVKKLGYFVCIAVAVIIDSVLGGTGAIRGAVIYFFIANEGISIIENWGNIGLPIPSILLENLEQLKNKK